MGASRRIAVLARTTFQLRAVSFVQNVEAKTASPDNRRVLFPSRPGTGLLLLSARKQAVDT
jgi:hypothetical protein